LPDVQLAAARDPRAFLAAYPPPAIFDEVQNAPQLLPYIRERVDADRGRPGQYVLSGLQNLLLLQNVTESLAGRAAVLRLLPFSRRELERRTDDRFPWEGARRRRSHADDLPQGARFCGVPRASTLWPAFLRGGYPEIALAPRRDFVLWHASYIRTYLERDVRAVRQIGDLTLFQDFMRVLAARSGQLLSLSDVSRDLGIAVNSVKAWLSVLVASHQVMIVRPYFANVGKRLVKTPKVYLTDVGTLCHLARLEDPAHASAGPMAGPILETAVLSELVRTFAHRGMEPEIHFWRTATGSEVDFVVETGQALVPIEVKLTATPTPRMALGIESFQADLGKRAARGYLVHLGTHRLPLGPDVEAYPFANL
jgi:hypothetical protein